MNRYETLREYVETYTPEMIESYDRNYPDQKESETQHRGGRMIIRGEASRMLMVKLDIILVTMWFMIGIILVGMWR